MQKSQDQVNIISKTRDSTTKMCRIFFLSILEFIKISPAFSIALVILVICQGALPVLAIKVSGSIIESMSNSNTNLLMLVTIWGSALFTAGLLGPIALFLQSSLADKPVYYINTAIMNKANSIKTLYSFEDKNFFNDIQVLQSGSHNKPVNLIVTAVGLVKDLVTIIACLLLLGSELGWLAFVLVIASYVNFKIYLGIQQEMWQESLGRSTESRRIQYLMSITINKSTAMEMRFFPLNRYIVKEYKKFLHLYIIGCSL